MNVTVTPPDTLDELELIRLKEDLAQKIKALQPGQRKTWIGRIGPEGTLLLEFDPSIDSASDLQESAYIYQLYDLPVSTDPLFLFGLLNEIRTPIQVISIFRGLNRHQVKSRIESSRKRSARSDVIVSNIDSDVTFEEATEVATAISRGSETLVEGSLLILSDVPLNLDPSLFCEEKSKTLRKLALQSALGIRKRLHRSFVMRLPTASDLVPNIGDPLLVDVPALLKTRRGKPLYLNFQDPSFSAFHMNVSGTTGVGKSVFVAALLNRMATSGVPISALFIDHLRSYRRLVRSKGGIYLEPDSHSELGQKLDLLLNPLNQPGTFHGIELSDLSGPEKKLALRILLEGVESFLKHRPTHHLVYVVMDECWSVLKDEPTLVQRAFREFRKLDGGAVAITQSLSDLLKEENGQAIFQNSPIQIILRQREDPAKYTGDLGLNSTEIEALRTLRQEKGAYAECLIKTPFYSRIGRLELTEAEHDLYRTDTVRRELVAERRHAQEGDSHV